jgi:hypothetical protein
MYYQLTRLSFQEVKQNGFKSQFSGSSSHRSWNGAVFKKPQKEKKPLPLPCETQKPILEKGEKIPTLYGLKKNKIRNKILSFFSLNKSKKFCAFYTITFPMGIDDDIAYQLLNTWLTRCRKSLNLKSYLWVAERQKNNTLHFHLITNKFMKIASTNEYMKAALYTQFKKGNLFCDESIIETYNGVDVDNVHKSKRKGKQGKRLSKEEAKKKLSFYLTKYVTKNDTKSERLPWHCSRDISALFISINYADVTDLEIAQLINDNPEAVVTYSEEFFTIHFFKFTPDEKYFSGLIAANNILYEKMHIN